MPSDGGGTRKKKSGPSKSDPQLTVPEFGDEAALKDAWEVRRAEPRDIPGINGMLDVLNPGFISPSEAASHVHIGTVNVACLTRDIQLSKRHRAGTLIGGNICFKAVSGGKDTLYSRFTWVSAGFRDKGCGRAIKLAQARMARGIGCTRIQWTTAYYLPRNLWLWLERLGARAVRYDGDYFRTEQAVTANATTESTTTPRLIFQWDLPTEGEFDPEWPSSTNKIEMPEDAPLLIEPEGEGKSGFAPKVNEDLLSVDALPTHLKIRVPRFYGKMWNDNRYHTRAQRWNGMIETVLPQIMGGQDSMFPQYVMVGASRDESYQGEDISADEFYSHFVDLHLVKKEALESGT